MRLAGVWTAIGSLLALIATTAAASTTAPSGVPATTTAPYGLPAALSVSVSGAGTVVGSGISCPRQCSKRFESPAMVTLTPRPAPGHYFTYWGGACWGEGTCRVAMNESQSVSALFIALPNTVIARHRLAGATLTVRMDGSGGAGRLQFRCRLDDGRFRTCDPRTTYAGLRPGRHTVAVQAIDGNSRRDPTPAKLTITVR